MSATPPPELQSLIETHVNGFNTQNSELFASVFSDTAIIIDGYAYAVISGNLAVTIKGQTVTRTGTLAYTFSEHGNEWKIDAQAWGRTS